MSVFAQNGLPELHTKDSWINTWLTRIQIRWMLARIKICKIGQSAHYKPKYARVSADL